MRKKNSRPFLLILAALLLVLSIPRGPSEKMRGAAAALFGPFWENLTLAKAAAFSWTKSDRLHPQSSSSPSKSYPEELERLSIENQLLRSQAAQLQELLNEKVSLEKEWSQLVDAAKEVTLSSAAGRHEQNLLHLLKLRLESLPARVIYRTPSTWNSSFWINVGQKQNEVLGREAIAKNSPVVIGRSLIGVVDYVGRSQSRVRLITDSGLYPAVRAARGKPQDRLLAELLQRVTAQLRHRPDLFKDHEEKAQFTALLQSLESKLGKEGAEWYLAKGELQGSSHPLWRSQGNILRGIGFNYDFCDEEGPARDLRTGKPYDSSSNLAALSILKPNDLLITTGLDGVFPPGLFVAEVKKIKTLKEGDYYYEIEAMPTAGNFDDVSLVFVLPPSGYNSEDLPVPFGA